MLLPQNGEGIDVNTSLKVQAAAPEKFTAFECFNGA
jgi:hypothetical protein